MRERERERDRGGERESSQTSNEHRVRVVEKSRQSRRKGGRYDKISELAETGL